MSQVMDFSFNEDIWLKRYRALIKLTLFILSYWAEHVFWTWVGWDEVPQFVQAQHVDGMEVPQLCVIAEITQHAFKGQRPEDNTSGTAEGYLFIRINQDVF